MYPVSTTSNCENSPTFEILKGQNCPLHLPPTNPQSGESPHIPLSPPLPILFFFLFLLPPFSSSPPAPPPLVSPPPHLVVSSITFLSPSRDSPLVKSLSNRNTREILETQLARTSPKQPSKNEICLESNLETSKTLGQAPQSR